MEKYDDIRKAIDFFIKEFERMEKDDEELDEQLYYYALAINALRIQLPS